MTKPDMKFIRERMVYAHDGEDAHHKRAADDLKFLTGPGQWPDAERQERERQGRPVLTFNLCVQSVERVKAQIRDMNPAVRVKAADSTSDPEIAKIYEGLVRHIELTSQATAIYEASGESAAACSMGYFRLRTVYVEGDTFDQEIVIERVYNPFSSFPDPMAKHPTRMDAKFWFLIEEVKLEDFKAQYPDARTEDFTGDHRPVDFMGWNYWQSGENVVVAEYFWIEDEKHEICLLPSGQIIRKDQLPKGMKASKTRTVKTPRVQWLKCSGAEILEGPTDVPGMYIPVVAVTGAEYQLAEESYRASVIRFAKDAQVAYNITRTSAIEVVLTQPKAPYFVTAEQVAGFEDFWNDANRANRPYLPYNQVDGSPPPMRLPPPMASQGLMAEAQIASDDVKRTTGIYDASLGQKSNETSGRAILARQSESEAGTSIYADNLVKGVEHCGRVIVGMIPEVYDAKRIIRILGVDGQESMVTINDMSVQDGMPVPVNDLTIGRYDVTISVGPSYDSKREEMGAMLTDLAKSIPAIGQIGGDLLVKALDMPDGDLLAERLRKTLPLGIAESPKKMTPEEQQQMQAQQAQMQKQQQMQDMAVGLEMDLKQADVRLKKAQADEAEANALKAAAEAKQAQLDFANASGQIEAALDNTARHAAAGAIGFTQGYNTPSGQ